MKFHAFSIRGLLATLLAASSCGAQPAAASLEERLIQIEKQLARLEGRLGDSAKAADLAAARQEVAELSRGLGWEGKSPLTVAKAAGKEQKLSIGGYVQTHAEFGDAIDSRYTGINNRVLLRRVRLTTKAAFSDGFELTLQPDFGNNSISGNTGYRGGLADAYFAWTKHEAANVQVGQFKTAYGFEQLLADTKTQMVERTLPNDLLTVGRQIGVAILGSVAQKRLSYNFGAYNGNGVNNGNNDNDHFMYAGRLTATAWTQGSDKLAFSANGYSSKDTGTFTGHRSNWGVDTQLTLGGFDFCAEYLHGLQNRYTGADTTADGWYALASYFVVPKTVQALLRYETYDANKHAPHSTSSIWTVGATYFLKGDDLKLNFNYLIGDPAGPLSGQKRFMTRLQMMF